MLQVLKILKGIDRLDPGHFFVFADQSNTRGHNLKLVKQRARSSLRQNTFSQRVNNDWNALQLFLREEINFFSGEQPQNRGGQTVHVVSYGTRNVRKR